ncbi:glycolate oxidase subunit GlcE, partial [Thioclava sp. BHET1]
MRADPATRAALPAFQPEPPALRALSDGLRARFDPRGILNPGLMA